MSLSGTVQTWAGLNTKDPDAIRNILDQEKPWRNVSGLRKDLAQDVVDLLQSELDDGAFSDIQYRTSCAKCLHELNLAYAVLPSKLCLPRSALVRREYRNYRSSERNYEHYRAVIRDPLRQVCLTRYRRPVYARKMDDKAFMQAALTWHQLRHENILPLYAVSTEIFTETFCFISPWTRWGNALDYLRENPKHDRHGWALDIAAAMRYLHQLDPCVVHGDIKAENILVRDDLRCYLSGFWERLVEHVNERARDVYSFGLTIIELYTGEQKFVDSAPKECPATWWDKVILPCVDPVSDQRPSADAIINALSKHHRAHFKDYLDGKHAPKGDHPAEDVFDWSFDSRGIPMWIAAAYIPPKLHDTTSKILETRLKQLEPWKDIVVGARDHGLDEQSVMDELQLELDQVATEDSEHRRKCIKCLRELSRQHDILPSQLKIPKTSFEQFNNTRLGGGGFSDIHKGTIMGHPVCVKSLRVHQTGPYSPERMKKILCQEALIWRQATHENILPFYGVSVDIISSGLCFVSPWMVHGNVRQYLNAHPTHNPLDWAGDVASAMQYLHSLDPCIIHKDIRGVNILVGNDLRAYLSDFGISLVVETRLPGTSLRMAGNIRWLPPELVNQSNGSHNIMKELDIYSFGCTVLEMYTCQDPYSQLSNEAAIIKSKTEKVLPQRPPSEILPTPLWESVVVPCLSWEPGDRPSADTILDILKSLDFKPFIHRYLNIWLEQDRAWRRIGEIPPRIAPQKVLDYLQSVRDELPLTDPEHQKKYVKCLRALSKKYEILPSQLYYSNSEIKDREQFQPGGTFSDISRATIVIQGRSCCVCLKRLRIRRLLKEFHDAIKVFTQEAFIWRQLRHENILPFYGVSTEVMDHSSLCLISPWMEDGNIRDFLARHPDHSRIRMLWLR